MTNNIFLKIILAIAFVVPINLYAGQSGAKEKPLEKERLDFGDVIKESTKEVKAAETNYTKTVKTKKYAPRKSKGKQKVKLNIPQETVEAKDNVQWDYNQKDALKKKKKLDTINTLEVTPKK
jgi:hypothetical protein